LGIPKGGEVFVKERGGGIQTKKVSKNIYWFGWKKQGGEGFAREEEGIPMICEKQLTNSVWGGGKGMDSRKEKKSSSE